MNRSGIKYIFRVSVCLLLLGFINISSGLFLPDSRLSPDKALAQTSQNITSSITYVGTSNLRIDVYPAHSSPSTVTLLDLTISFWRYKEGDSKISAVKRGESLIWKPGQSMPTWYDTIDEDDYSGENSFLYYAKGIFRYTNTETGAEVLVEGEYDVTGTATPGKVWGTITRDTLWDKNAEMSKAVRVAEGANLTISSGVQISNFDTEYYDHYYTMTVQGSLVADGVTFDDMYIEASGPVTVKGCTFIKYFYLSSSSPQTLFQNNQGSVWGAVHIGSSEPISGNNLPKMDLFLRGQPGTQCMSNTFEKISISNSVCNQESGSGVSIEANTIYELILSNAPCVHVFNNTLEIVRVTNFNGPGGAVIEDNTFLENKSNFLDLKDCQQKDYEPIVFQRNKGIYNIYLTNVSGALISENEIGGWEILYSFGGNGIKISSGSFNIIQDNIIQVPESVKPYNHYYAGIALGLEGNDNEDGSPKVTDNQILNNSITNYNIGIGLGSAARNEISGNTIKGNMASIHIGPHDRQNRGTIYGTAQPRENEIWNNILVHYDYGYNQGVNIQIDVASEDCENTWNTDITAGGNAAGGAFMGGNYWSDYEDKYQEKDENKDEIWDDPYIIDDSNRDKYPLVMPVALTLREGNLNPANVFEFYGLESEEDYTKGKENVIAAHFTLTANRKGSWNVTGLVFSTSGTGNEKEDILRARLYKDSLDGALLGEAVFDQDNGGLVFSFDPAIYIPTDQSVSLILVYDFIPDQAFPCNDYRAVISTSGIEAAPSYAESGRLLPEGGSVQGIIRVKPGLLVKKEGDNQFGEAKDPATNSPLAIPLKTRITWQHPLTVDYVEYKIVTNLESGAFLQHGEDEKRLLSEITLNEEGYAEEIMTLGTKKGLKRPYSVEIKPVSKGAQCQAEPEPPFFTAWGLGVELEATSQYDNPSDSSTFGTFLSTIQVDNRFILNIVDMAPAPPDCVVEEVLFTMGGSTVTGTEVTKNTVYEAAFDMSAFDRPQKLLVTIKLADIHGVKSEQQEEYDVKAIKIPSWVDSITKISESVTKDFSDEDGGTYTFTFNYPTNFIWSEYVPESVGFLGGLENDLDIEFSASAIYRVNETSAFEANLVGKPTILGKEFDMEGSLTGEFDSNFSFQRGAGNIGSSVSFDLPSKGYSRTFLIYGVPVTAAVDLSGEVSIFVKGSAVLNRRLEFEEITIAPGTTVTGNITVSLAAVFGLAKIAATGSPTVTMEIELKYTSVNGTVTTWRGEVVVPITVTGSIFWGLGSATLCETQLGPWTFGSGAAPQAYRPLSVVYPGSPRLLSTSDLTVDNAGRKMSVWIGDTQANETEPPNPDVFFMFDSGSGWSTPAPIIGDASPNEEWETDPRSVFMKDGAALACWTANNGDKSLADGPNDESNPKLDTILSYQDIACSYWNGAAWAEPIKISDDNNIDPRADGTVSLSYFAENRTMAVWVHNADSEKRAMQRTAWQLRWSVFDATAGVGATAYTEPAVVPETNTGKAEQMPAVAADGAGGAMLVWARDDDGSFHTELSSIANGTNVNFTNPDSHIMYSVWSGSAWSAPLYLATGNDVTRFSPSLASAPNNRFIAVWTEKEPDSPMRLMYAVWSEGAWTSGTVTESLQLIEEPQVAVDALGKATVIWRSNRAGGKGALFSSTGSIGTQITWTEPQQITHDDTVQWQPVIAVDSNNQVIAAWSAYDAKTGEKLSGSGLSDGVNIVNPNPKSAAITGTYSDRGVDANTDNVYEALEISVEVNIINAGDYLIKGDLYKDARYIASSEISMNDMQTGDNTALLTFPGGILSDQGLDGPYTLKNLVILDCNDSPVQTAFADTAYTTTGTYKASDFVEGPLSLDAESYMGTGAKAIITVNDPAANTDPESAQTVTVAVSSTGDAKGFSIALIETGPDTGIFQRDMGFSLVESSSELRQILISDHDMFRVIYYDSVLDHSFTNSALWMSAGAGDVNGDGDIDLADAILTLQSIAKIATLDQGVTRAADVNGDEKIGVEEAIHIFRIMAE